MQRITKLCVVLFLSSLSLSAQKTVIPTNYKIIHHGVENGLSQGTAYSILKDSRGFMWFTSYEGLNRFDGHEITVYSESLKNPNSLKGSHTFGLVEDPYGNIWTGTDISLNRYLRTSNNFEFVFTEDDKGGTISSVNYPFFADSLEVWYINSEEGILAYDFIKNQKRIITTDFLYQHSSYIINSTKCTKDGIIWHRDKIGLARIDPYSGAYQWFFSDKKNNVIGEAMKLVCFYQDPKGIIWLGYGNGVIRFDYSTGKYKKIPLDQHISTPVDDIMQDSLGFYWLGTEQDGLLCYSENRGVIEHYQAKGNTDKRLASQAIATVYIDNQGLIWVNPDPEGIDVLVPNLKPFKKYSSDFFDPTIFSTKGVRTFLETADGNIWIGTQSDGLLVFNPNTSKIVKRIIPGKNGFTPNTATSLLLDNQNRIWVGTYDGLYLSENNGNDFQRILNQSRPERIISSNFISDLLVLEDNTLVFSTEEGTYYIPPKQLNPIPIDTLQHVIVNGLFLLDKNYLLISEHHKGFHVLKISDWIMTQGKGDLTPTKFQHCLPQFNIKDFFQFENDSILWLATNTGLLKTSYNKDWSELKLLKHYSRDSGLPSNYIYGILPDKNKYLWMSSNKGISCFNPLTETFTNYSIDDGLQGYEFNSNAFMKRKDGELYFGGTDGFNRFYPTFQKNKITPTLQITEFKVNDTLFDKKKYIGEIEKVDLAYDENTFSIQFSAIDYHSNGKNQYQTILENYDDTWKELGHTNHIRYTKVNPGNYVFKVKAANNDGLWTDQAKTLHIHIATPWYSTWWAYLLYFSCISLVLFQIYQIRIRRRLLKQQLLFEQKEANRLQELDTFKTRFYANITHEFRTPLTVIQGMADQLKEKPKQEAEVKINLIKKNSSRLLSLVNQMLELSKLRAGKARLDLEQVDVFVFIKYLVEAHESLAKMKNINLEFSTGEEYLIIDFDAQKLENIMTNLIANAVKFTPEYGEILVLARKSIRGNETRLEIQVTDNGIGISEEQLPFIFDRFHQANPAHEDQGSGIGLALVKELIGIMHGEIKVESEIDKGTTFSISFPIQEKASLAATTTPIKSIKTPTPILQYTVENESNKPDNGLPILLIIEDNKDVIFYLQKCLENDYQILTSRNGEAGIEQAIATIPDIIISDVMMPKMDGFEVCKRLKKDERTNHIPIILLTAKATDKDKLEGLSHGADAYLIKPFQKEELMIRLAKLMKVRKVLQKKYSTTLVSSETETDIPKTIESTFIKKIEKIVLEHLEEEAFSIDDLAQVVYLSRSQLHRKIKALTGMSTAIYIRHIRLQKAKELLLSSDLTISEIAYQVGFKTPVYFSQVFKTTFGESPSDTRK